MLKWFGNVRVCVLGHNCQYDVGVVNSQSSLTLRELCRTLEHKVTLAVLLIPGTLSGTAAPPQR